ncbi:NACHT domain-containing protein [Streptomyces sp. NPDC002730]|uniref:NACHT domain-containing protein n=1 Tax=Streptomyces sp. NPDC002730 TaxID=3364662 RepID=UPI0036928F85
MGQGRGPKRVGVPYFLLLALGGIGALALAWHFKLGRAAMAAALLPTLAPAYLGWKSFKQGHPTVDLEKAADQLTQAIKNQWDDEAAIRRLNDPYPLPVAWRAADPELVEPWELLADVVRSWPGGQPEGSARWPADPAGLAGSDGQLGEVFAQRVPTRRLVVLGDPGSGKTMLLIRLLQELVEKRLKGGPVPVLFSLASWDPARQPLKYWLAEQLRRSYPGLRTPAPAVAPAAAQVDLAQAMLDARLILPLLDGFDELPPTLHAMALDALNRALPAKQPLVIASRATAYRDALTRPDAMVRLNGAAGIHLLPLTAGQAAAYLRRDAGGPHSSAADRWDTVANHLGTDTPVGQALSTPLGLFLARTIYNPRCHYQATPDAIPHPDELCDNTAYPTRAALDVHLFNAYIPAAYAAHHPNPPRWTTGQAHRTLIYLARHLETNREGSPDLAWWELQHAIPAYIRRLTVGLAVGIVGWLAFGLTGLLVGGLAGTLGSMPSNAPSAQLRWSSRRFAAWLAIGLMSGLVLGLGFGLAFGLADDRGGRLAYGIWPGEHGFVGWLVFGLVLGLICGLVLGFAFGFTGEKPDPAVMTGPATLLTQDRRAFLASALAYRFGAGFAGWFVGFYVSWLAYEQGGGWAVGVAFGLAYALGAALGQTAWGGWLMAKAWLAMRRQVPWHLMSFLQDAHQHHGVLRQAGAVYQFRHLDLQRHLAQEPRPVRRGGRRRSSRSGLRFRATA